MSMDKQFWKTIYYWIRYPNFDIVSGKEDDQEIWLTCRRKKQVVISKRYIRSTQEIRFDEAKVLEHKDGVANFVSFEPQSLEFYYLIESEFSEEQLNEASPARIKFNVVRHTRDLIGHMSNILLTRFIPEDSDKKTYMFYKRKVLTDNFLDKYMQKLSPATYAMVFVNILIWLCVILYLNNFPDVKLLDVGGLVYFDIIHGEWYRIVTSMFLYFSFERILMNMLSLFIFGKIAKAIIGLWRMLTIYFIAELFGNFISLSPNATTISVGASGAIFDLTESIFAMMYVPETFNRKISGQLPIALVILVGASLFISNINIVAHTGEFIGGLLITLIGYYYKANLDIFWILLIGMLVILIALQTRIFIIKEDNIYNKLIKDDMTSSNYGNAQSIAKQTASKNYADDWTYYLNSMIMATISSKPGGIVEWKRGPRMFPKLGLLSSELAITNRSLNDDEKVLKYVHKTLNADSRSTDYISLEKELTESNESKNK